MVEKMHIYTAPEYFLTAGECAMIRRDFKGGAGCPCCGQPIHGLGPDEEHVVAEGVRFCATCTHGNHFEWPESVWLILSALACRKCVPES